MQTELERIEALLQLVADEGIDALDVSSAQLSIHIRRQAVPGHAPAPVAAGGELSAVAESARDEGGEAVSDADTLEICAPVDGVFYRSATAGGLPLCEPGARVAAGAALGIIETMKIMNEIKAPEGGVLKAVLPADGASVSQGQVLFIIRKG